MIPLRLQIVLSAAPLALALAACAPSVPDSGAGVGFQDYNSYMRQSAAAVPAAPSYGAPASSPQSFDPLSAAAAIDRAEGRGAPAPAQVPFSGAAPYAPPATGTLDPARPRANAPSNIQVQTGELVHIRPTGVSDENDFNAVAARESIQSDAQRIAQNRAQYVVVEPRNLPQRPGETGPNIVAYALASTHARGTQMYPRGGMFGVKDSTRACAQYVSSDQAQADFLAKGGPQKDRLGLDPDGDGYACAWDPTPFRKVMQ